MNDRADAVVVGAGCLGTAIAWELSRAGYGTMCLDRLGAPGHGSTSASASILRVYSSTVETALLAWETVPIWEDLATHLGADPGEEPLARYVRTGSLVIEGGHGGIDRLAPVLAELGIGHDVWDADAMAGRLPHFDLHSFWPPRALDDDRFYDEPTRMLERALYVPEGGYVVDAGLAAANLAAAARRAGARFRFRTEVTAIREKGGAVVGVSLADGTHVDSPVVVNAAGPHASRLNRLAGVEDGMRVRTRPLRHELHLVEAPAELAGGDIGPCVSDGDLAVNFRPEPGGHILVGSEDPDCDPVEWIDDADRWLDTPTPEQWERQVFRLARRIPGLRIPHRPRGLAGLYDVSDDWMPIYDRADLDGFYMACGSSGTQFKAAPTAGLLMARLIDACQNGHDHDAAPLRVRLPHRGVDLDLGAFSRLRSPRTDSGFI